MEKLINAMPLLTSLVLGVLFAIGLSWQGLQIQDAVTRDGNEKQQETDGEPGKDAPAQTVDLEELTFFGKPGDDSEPEVTETEDLPETNLQLVLRGVMDGGREQRDSALVEDPDGETKVYRVSESLPGEAVLRKVHQRRVVIERGGSMETLSFPENEPGDSMTVSSANGSSSQSGSEPEAEASDSGSSDNRSSNDGSRNSRMQGRDEDVRERLNKLRERLSDD